MNNNISIIMELNDVIYAINNRKSQLYENMMVVADNNSDLTLYLDYSGDTYDSASPMFVIESPDEIVSSRSIGMKHIEETYYEFLKLLDN